MSTSVDSHRGAGPSDEDGEPDDVTAPLRRPAPEDTATDRFPVPDDGSGPVGWFDAAPRPTAAAARPAPPATSAGPAVAAAAPPAESTVASASVAPAPSPSTPSPQPRAPRPTTASPTPSDAPDVSDAAAAAAPADPPVEPGEPGEPTDAPRPRRRSRGMRVPAGAPVVVDDQQGTTAAPAAAPPPWRPDGHDAVAARPRPTPAPRPTGPAGPVLPVGGPPAPSTPKEPPTKHTAALGRLALVLVLVAAVVGTVVVLQQRSQFGRTDAGADEIPALEVAPAQVDLNTVGQPNALAPPAALLPGTTGAPAAGRPPTISAWANGLAPRTNIPAIALQAYGMSDLAMKKLDPACHLSWVTLAGLGRIESNHGRYRGASIAPNGAVTPPIIGVPLDGTGGNRAIAGSDGNYDRAEGPMQFIESTWARWGSDGNGDGVADPNNIYDAAFTAGRYLCAGGRDLATGEGWRDAVLSYNFSDDYGRRVYAAAQAYANSTAP
ncbi:lytic transglycosylase domain-containing protein [Actinomycetospora sp. CA-084318]|uniref:lytic transglycosylase domain-containing protein n=1 Tax=Actinomycetospora sp. CA-084318 TaxID=3239892 RepID=UPI003D96DA51